MKLQPKINSVFIILLLFYLFVILGMLLHTSVHPVIAGKYTVKYILILIAFTILPPIAYIIGEKLPAQVSKRTFIFFIVALLISTVAFSEIFLRIKFKNYESDYYTSTLDDFHRFLQSQPAQSDNIHINSLGFRGEEIQEKKPVGTYRVVVLGGSTVLNREVSFEKNAVRLLEKKLRAYYPQKKIEVINAGQSGYNTEHSVILYMFKVRDLQPDLVIMWQGANDMVESCTTDAYTYPYGVYKPDYSHKFGALAQLATNYYHLQPIFQIKIVTLDFLIKAIRDNFYSDITNSIRSYIAQRQAEYYMLNKNTITVHDYPSINAYTRNLYYLISLTKHDNIPLILGDQPNLFITHPTLEETESISFPRPFCIKNNKNYSFESLHYGITLFNNATKEIAQKNNIDFISLDSKVPKNLSYFLDSVHYTEKGNEIISQVLFKEITDKHFLK